MNSPLSLDSKKSDNPMTIAFSKYYLNNVII